MQIEWYGQSAFRLTGGASSVVIDLLFVPVGGGPTIGAAAVCERLRPRWIVPMHYGTGRLGFLDPPEPFLERMPRVSRLSAPRPSRRSSWRQTTGSPWCSCPRRPSLASCSRARTARRASRGRACRTSD
jgi:L-ascorbate metabolism protein UlaG (beta-lactamase superfamily)